MRTTVQIDGMRAVHCVRAVQTALTMVPGIRWCDVTMGMAEVEHDGQATPEALGDAIAVAGFTVRALQHARHLPVAGGP